ncbi:OLC1v1002837C1 [Oldenlandia corymbosa var. corymbosa]|uniref:OLC1v1002837C1 n=1 Tax=Oldenlandia corymbosa var. corymbosa TaxID=529605 RepID=A0AAV1D9F5_OLDCO|nr:OLC1v1002837C1 [Oldenlandia corymbosa var. corymbosa]
MTTTVANSNPNSNSIRELNSQLTQIVNEFEAEKKKGEAFDLMWKARQNHYWWESPIDELGLHELEQLRDYMKDLKKSVTEQVGKYETKPTTGVNLGSMTSNFYGFGYDHHHGLF